MNNKCVYLHYIGDDVVYIGSGSEYRSRSKTKRTSQHLSTWKDISVVIVASCKSSSEAKTIEQELITKYWSSGKLFNIKKTTDQVMILDYDFLSDWLYYDETAPSCLKWKQPIPTFKIKAGDNAGSMSKLGYYQVKLKARLYKCHRIIWVLNSKQDIENGYVIDHINGIRSDNNISNLRVVTTSTNNRNRSHKQSNTGFQGICEYKSRMHFTVQFSQGHKSQIGILFSYKDDSVRPAKNHYKTRDEALAAALSCRAELVEQGLITIINREEQHGSN